MGLLSRFTDECAAGPFSPTGYIIQWWATYAKSYSILFKWSRVPNWRHESLGVFRILFDSENRNNRQWLWGNDSQSKMLINLHLLQTKQPINTVMHNGTIMIFGGIRKDAGLIYNQKKVWLRDFRCQSKSGIIGFFKHLHYSIYKPSQWKYVVLWVTHHCII